MAQVKFYLKKVVDAISMAIVVVEILIIASILVAKFSGNIPSIFGHHLYVIVSPSMTPDLEVGDVIISRAYDGGELKVGQIVEYVGKSGQMEGKIITHRIKSITGEGDERVIVTRGTANTADDAPISPDDIVAVMVYKTAFISNVYGIISTTTGFVLLILLPMSAMIIFELVKLLLEVKKGEKNDEE